jgi:hypothetical protein
MNNIPPIHPGIKPGCPDRCPSPSRRPVDPHKLDGADRRAWERAILDTPGLKGSRLHLARVLLDEFCWGKCWCYPGDELLARKVGVGTATIGRALRDLADLGVIRIVRVRGRRRIVFPSHPHSAAYLAGLGIPADPAPVAAEAPVPGVEPVVAEAPVEIHPPAPTGPIPTGLVPAADHPDGPVDQSVPTADQSVPPANHFDRRIVDVKPGEEACTEPACAREGGPDSSPLGLNELTTEGDPEAPGRASTPRPFTPPRRPLRGIPDLAGAPVDDPIIAAELARRDRARGTATPMSPAERAELRAEALSGGGREVAADVGPAAAPAADGNREGPADIPGRAVAIAAEAATIEALAKLGPGATRGEVLAATIRLAALFRDPGSRAYYRSVCNDVAAGRLPARVPIAAVGSARASGIRNPGAAFTAHIRRCRAAAEARRPMRA